MNIDKGKYDHLIKNLERISFEKSIFNYESGRRAFLSLGKGNIHVWLNSLLPNTRLIIEPKIIGSSIAILYINGKLKKAINKTSTVITDEVRNLINVPKTIPIKQRIEIRGVLYHDTNKSQLKNTKEKIDTIKPLNQKIGPNFCAFHIFNCRINQFQSLKELKKLKFEIPESQFTKFISDIEIYRHCWKEGKLFKNYPTCGIVLKINSRKLQKCLGENNVSIHWAYTIN